MVKGLLVGVTLIATASLPGQVRPGGGRSFGGGWGNVLFPGGRPASNTFVGGYDFAHRLGGTVAGVPYGGGVRGGFRGGYRNNFLGNQGYYYLPMPLYVGDYFGGYGYGYPPPAEGQPNVIVVQQPPSSGQAPVVINQTFVPDTAHPVVREYPPGPNTDPDPSTSGLRTYEAPVPTPAPDPGQDNGRQAVDVNQQKATIYLIAFKDQTIQAAYAYWVEGNTLHYVTVQGSHNRATLDLIDREMSDRLNRERNIDFTLGRAR